MYLTRVRWESVWNIKSLNMFMSISPKIFHKNKYMVLNDITIISITNVTFTPLHGYE